MKFAKAFKSARFVCIGNHMRPSTIKDKLHESFGNFPKLPESRSDEGNLENFQNTSAINP